MHQLTTSSPLPLHMHTFDGQPHIPHPPTPLPPPLPLQITFKGDGMIDGVMAIADTRGNVKGRVGNPAADPPLRADGKLAVGDAVGQGARQGRQVQQACQPGPGLSDASTLPT